MPSTIATLQNLFNIAFTTEAVRCSVFLICQCSEPTFRDSGERYKYNFDLYVSKFDLYILYLYLYKSKF